MANGSRLGIGRLVPAVTVLALLASPARAVDIPVVADYESMVARQNRVEATSEFGERLNLYDGSVVFSVTPVDIPGNSRIPVSVTYVLRVADKQFNTPFVYEIDVPYLSGVYKSGAGWTVEGSNPAARCTFNGGAPQPPEVTNSSGKPDTFFPEEYWHGNYLNVPGSGPQLMMVTKPEDAIQPSDGKAYRWVTQNRWYFSCINSIAGGGEGFVGHSPDGLKYYFDQIGTTSAWDGISKPAPQGSTTILSRREVAIRASRIEDNYGNWVNYGYVDGKLSSISSSDGRSVQISAAQISSAGRLWSVDTSNGLAIGYPDGTSYQAQISNGIERIGWRAIGCGYGDALRNSRGTMIVSIRSRSGATSTFSFEPVLKGQTQVPLRCIDGMLTGPSALERTVSLKSKAVTGPGIQVAQWNYGYSSNGCYYRSGNDIPQAGYECLPNTPSVRTVTVNGPTYTRVMNFSNRHGVDAGQLLLDELRTQAGVTLRSDTYSYRHVGAAGGTGFATAGDPSAFAESWLELSSTTQQDGDTFQSQVLQFDAFDRPSVVKESNSFGFTRTEQRTFYDDRVRWHVGQPQALVDEGSGLVVWQVEYGSDGLPARDISFSRLVRSKAYNSDATIASISDGRGNATAFSGWKRGIAQTWNLPGGSSRSAEVDDNGWVKSATDETGATTKFGYDLMGLLTEKRYPEADSVTWNVETSSLGQIASAEFGLNAGHWKHTSAVGNARTEQYFDSLWQLVLSRSYDVSDVDGTQAFRRYVYDTEGRQIFSSYPGSSPSSTMGLWTEYDALGRVTSESEDSENGILITRYEYLSGGRVRKTDPLGRQTITAFQMYRDIDYSYPVAATRPESALTSVVRDVFGKPMEITSQSTSGAEHLTRKYIYNPQQQLCKIVEPETGATAFGYDSAGNLAWSASGLDLPSATTCDSDAAYGSGVRVDSTYDQRNRLLTVAYPDGDGDRIWAYEPDGRPSQLTTLSGGDVIVNAFTYNKRRLLTGESSQIEGSHLWSVGYSYDANGSVSGVRYPRGSFVELSPNALGQPTRAGSYATSVAYHPNGSVRKFTYGNGVAYSLAQNDRQLPLRLIEGGVQDVGYSYDRAGNTTEITDHLSSDRTQLLAYDGLDRVLQSRSPALQGAGVIDYSYDALGNLRSAKLVGRKEHNYWYDARNRLTNVQSNDGATQIGMAYDSRGNLAVKNGQPFKFDHGNRLREIEALESYRYDGFGRRVRSVDASGASIISMYTRDGRLIRQQNQRTRQDTEFVYLSDRLIAEIVANDDPDPPTIQVPSRSENGTFTVVWSTSTLAAAYQLNQRTGGGAWQQVYVGPMGSWTASSLAPGFYEYRVRGCKASGSCGDWSTNGAIAVRQPPDGAPAITTPGLSTSGSYGVSWSAVVGSSTYSLEESSSGAPWSVVQSSDTRSWTAGGKQAGSYSYRAKACNAAGCGAYSAVVTTRVVFKPAAPALSVPMQSYVDHFDVHWSQSAGASEFRLEGSTNGSAWVLVSTGPAVSASIAGRGAGSHSFRVQACNEAGCGDYSSVATIVVTLPPGSAPGMDVPSSSSTGSYTASWSSVAAATRYVLEESANGAGWVAIQDSSALSAPLYGRSSGGYGYRVIACNVAGCGPYSDTRTIAVLLPPSTPNPSGSVEYFYDDDPKRPAREDTLNWFAIPFASHYEVRVGDGATIYSGSSNFYTRRHTSIKTSYQYSVRACNASGCSGWSNSVTLP